MMKGFTIIEVVISVLIASMAVMASFSVVLSSFVSADKAEKKQEAATIIRYASEKLKAYVSADPNLVNYPLPGGGVGGGKWSEDDRLWALDTGLHTITPFLDRVDPCPDCTFPTPRSLTYFVTDRACGTFTCKEVKFTFTYTE